MVPDFSLLENSNLSTESIRRNILPHYNMQDAEISVIKFKNTEKQRAVYKIIHKNKSYCLKKVYYDIPDLLYVYSSIQWLYEKDIRVPKLLPTLEKSRFVDYNNMLFLLTPWVYGERCNFDNKEHVMTAVRKLSKIHSVSRNFHPIAGSLSRKGFDDYYISTLKHFEDLLKCSNKAFLSRDKFSKRFISKFEINMELAKISLELANKIDNKDLSRSLCHGDYVNKNLIFPPDNDPWIIDFDKCKFDYSMRDLSYFMRRLLKRENTKWDIDLAMDILKEYNSKCSFTNSDLAYVLAYVCFPQKYWKISRDYYKNLKRCNRSAFITLITNATCRCDFQYEFAVNIIEKVQNEFNFSY